MANDKERPHCRLIYLNNPPILCPLSSGVAGIRSIFLWNQHPHGTIIVGIYVRYSFGKLTFDIFTALFRFAQQKELILPNKKGHYI